MAKGSAAVIRHSGGGRNPIISKPEVPAFAGTTILFALLALLACAPAQAATPPPAPVKADPKQGEISYSYYLISCGSFIEHRQPGAQNGYDTTADNFYVAGWLSAYNRLRPDTGIPDDTTLDNIMLWLDQYCRRNPLSNLEEGLFLLGDEVRQRHEDTQASPQPVPTPEAKSPVAIAPKQPSVNGLKPLPY